MTSQQGAIEVIAPCCVFWRRSLASNPARQWNVPALANDRLSLRREDPVPQPRGRIRGIKPLARDDEDLRDQRILALANRIERRLDAIYCDRSRAGTSRHKSL